MNHAPAALRAYDALNHAAHKIATADHARQYAAHVKARRSPRSYRFHPPAIQIAMVEAMPLVLAGRITPEEAMALLHTPEHNAARFGPGAGPVSGFTLPAVLDLAVSRRMGAAY